VRLKVELSAHTPKPELVVALAARTCYSDKELALSTKELSPQLAGQIITKVVQRGHLSVLEHAVFTFSVEGLSRAASHQLVRHRIASYSQQSQRYVEFKGLEYIMPPSIQERTELERYYPTYQFGLFETCPSDIEREKLARSFDQFMYEAYKLYRRLVDSGLPKEDARFVLPNACATKLIITMNARELLHVFNLRLCSRAQWEIRELANQMLGLCYKVAPTIFSMAGPGCRFGSCPEGDMTCGVKWVAPWEK
jgi:thymidylate synthase (FAD)